MSVCDVTMSIHNNVNGLQVNLTTTAESVLSRCILCGEGTKERVTESQLLTLMECLTSNKYEDGSQTDEGKAIVFCLKCQKCVKEWHDLMDSVSLALQQARQIKCTLIASILSSHQKSPEDSDNQSETSDLTNSAVLKVFSAVRKEIFDEYNARVLLEKIGIPNEENQDEVVVKCEAADAEENYVVDIEIYSDNNLQDDDSSESSSSSDHRVKPSHKRQRFGPPRRKLEVNSSGRNQKCIETGPNEFLYAEKFKIEFKDDFYNCPECPKKFNSKAKILGHIRYKHDSARETGYKKKAAGHSSLFSWERIGPDEFVYAEKFKFKRNNNNQYQCDTCEAIYNSRPGIFVHIRNAHLRGGQGEKLITVKVQKDVQKTSDQPHRSVSPVPKGGKKKQLTGKKLARKSRGEVVEPSYPAEFVQPVENNPDQFLYFGKYTVTLVDGKLVCPVCHLERPKHKYMLNHIKLRHYKRSLGRSIKETAPNEFLYHEKYPFKFVESDNVYECGTCNLRLEKMKGIMPHIRLTHYTAQDKQQFSAVQISETEYLYAGKYKINYRDGRYHCSLCDFSRFTMSDLYVHYRISHKGKDLNSEKSTAVSNEANGSNRGDEGTAKINTTDGITHAECREIPHPFNNIQDNSSSDLSTLSDEDDVKPSLKRQRLGPTKKKLKRKSSVQKHKWIETGPNEFLYAEKFKVEFKDDFYNCPECPKRFDSKANIMGHIRYMHNSVKEKMNHPRSIKETLPNEFLYHEKYPFKFIESEDVYECGICELRSEKMKGILPHIRATHYTAQDKQQFIAVQISETEYLYAGNYKINYMDGRYYCSLCDFSRFGISELYIHYRISHQEKNATTDSATVLPDEACGSNQGDKDTAKISTTDGITHAEYRGIPYTFNSVLRKYSCGDCGTQINSRNYLQQHIRTHLVQTRDFICEVCGDSFLTYQHLRQHRARHGRKFSCKYCPKIFKSRSVFKAHVAIHEKGEDAKRFQCEHCGKKFMERNYLANHVRLHTGEKPHKCIICGECFTDSGRLCYHRKSVHGIEPQKKPLD